MVAEEDTISVPIYADALGAGTGDAPRDEVVARGEFFREWLRVEVGIRPGRAFIAPVRGRSMEEVLYDGDLVLGVQVETLETDDIYVTRYNGELKIKHTFRRGGAVVLRSEQERYTDIEVTAEDEFEVLGRAVRRIVR
jgi:phage repressor protein C with HTH and peptisase S24 domain